LILCDEIQGEGRHCLDTIKVYPEKVVWGANTKKPAKIHYDTLKNELETSIPRGSIIRDRKRFNIAPLVTLNLENKILPYK
jgi:hypothetical protein